jgi:hypothetical protein
MTYFGQKSEPDDCAPVVFHIASEGQTSHLTLSDEFARSQSTAKPAQPEPEGPAVVQTGGHDLGKGLPGLGQPADDFLA